MPSASRIALFGGTFDPPHLGHLAIAEDTVKVCGVDAVVFIPCRQSPHKDERTVATAEQRCEMLRLCTADKPWAKISRVELDRPEPSFSWQTAQEFADEYPDAELFWILGQDQWDVIETWGRPELLRALVTFVVFPRNSRSPGPKEGFRARFLERTHPASASGIREAVKENEDATAFLHPDVARFIKEGGLYSLGA